MLRHPDACGRTLAQSRVEWRAVRRAIVGNRIGTDGRRRFAVPYASNNRAIVVRRVQCNGRRSAFHDSSVREKGTARLLTCPSEHGRTNHTSRGLIRQTSYVCTNAPRRGRSPDERAHRMRAPLRTMRQSQYGKTDSTPPVSRFSAGTTADAPRLLTKSFPDRRILLCNRTRTLLRKKRSERPRHLRTNTPRRVAVVRIESLLANLCKKSRLRVGLRLSRTGVLPGRWGRLRRRELRANHCRNCNGFRPRLAMCRGHNGHLVPRNAGNSRRRPMVRKKKIHEHPTHDGADDEFRHVVPKAGLPRR